MLAARRLFVHPVGSPITDNFNRANSGSLGTTSDGNATWTDRSGNAVGPIGIISNKAMLQPADGGYRIATIPGGDTGTLQATIPDSSTVNRQGGIVFRYQDASNYWYVSVGNGTLSVSHVGGPGVVYTGAGADGDVIAVDFTPAGLEVFRNGSSVYTRSDTALNASTDVGIYVFNGGSGGGSVDDFSWTPA